MYILYNLSMKTKRNIIIEDEFSKRVDSYRCLLFEAEVNNSQTNKELKSHLDSLAEKIVTEYKIEEINKIPGILYTREAYKACGKDPNRYRPSQEQMMRRIVRGLGLYNVNNLVDAGNLISLSIGCSVGFFDADKITGNEIYLGIGKKDEPYEGIGRGHINIEGLPVFRDAIGGIGTPTSDNERTKIELNTTHLLATVHIFNPDVRIEEVIRVVSEILTSYCNAKEICWTQYSGNNNKDSKNKD